MQKKTKDEEIIEKKTKTATKKVTAVKKDIKTTAKKVVPKKTETKKSTAKKTVSKTTTKKAGVTTKTVKKEVVPKETGTKKAAAKKTSTKKLTTVKKDTDTKTVAKKTATKKATTSKTTAKKSTTKKPTTKTTTTKKSTNKKTTAKKESVKKVVKKDFVDIPEYYDLPYRYNKTIVRVLAQNPNTLFVYWDINDKDREMFQLQYGEDFFYKTQPVLIIHNLTEHYTYEIQIDDFANNWYVHVNDSKCKYIAELGRKPIDQIDEVAVGYVSVYFSNEIETPNDHVLFYNNNQVVNFKNIKTNKITQRIIKLNDIFKRQLRELYKNYNLTEEENYFDFQNPSSQNPSSTFI